MYFIMIAQCISPMIIVLLLSYHSRVTSSQTVSFSQPATGPSRVCEGSDVTLQCVILLIIDNATTVQPSVWTRNGVLASTIPNHRQVINSTTGAFTDLVITNVSLADDNTVYTCTDSSVTITSSLVLNVTDPLDAQLNLTEDNRGVDSFDISWRLLTQLPCDNELSYKVALSVRTLTGNYSTIMITITDVTSFSFSNLTSNTLYLVEVFLIHYDVVSNKSHTMNVNTKIEPSTITNFLTTNFRPVSEICVTSFNISWEISNNITCGDISYEVSISPPPIEGDAVTATDNMFYNVTGLNNSLPNVTITVTSRNRAGQGNNKTVFVELPKPLDPPPVYNITTSSSITPADLTGFDIIISWSRPAIDSCTTLPITGYYIHAIVTNTNGDVNEIVYTSNDIDDMLGGIMGEFSVSYNDSFEQDLYPNANYIFIVKIHNNVSKITRANARPSCTDDESDDELSTGAAVAISVVVTFIITLIVTALITHIITSLYYKYRYELKEKVTVNDDNTKQKDLYGGNITMDTNPAYATTATIKMDTNPAYAITT